MFTKITEFQLELLDVFGCDNGGFRLSGILYDDERVLCKIELFRI